MTLAIMFGTTPMGIAQFHAMDACRILDARKLIGGIRFDPFNEREGVALRR